MCIRDRVGADGSVTTVAAFDGPVMTPVQIAGRETSMRLPFGTTPTWATDGDNVYLARGDSAEVFTYAGGESRAAVWESRPGGVTPSDSERGAAVYREVAGEDTLFLPKWETFELPQAMPVVNGVLAGADGSVWVRRYPRAAGGLPHLYALRSGDEPDRWWVLDGGGGVRGEVVVPSGFTVLAVFDDGRVAGVMRDPLGVERIYVYELMGG